MPEGVKFNQAHIYFKRTGKKTKEFMFVFIQKKKKQAK